MSGENTSAKNASPQTLEAMQEALEVLKLIAAYGFPTLLSGSMGVSAITKLEAALAVEDPPY